MAKSKINESEANKKAVTNAVLEFANAYTLKGKKKVVENFQEELLSDEADQIFINIIEGYKKANDEEAVQQLRSYRMLLQKCRNEGIDIAFADQGSRIPAELEKAVMEFINEQDYGKAMNIVQQHQNLLFDEKADRVISMMMNRYSDDENILKYLIQRQELLANCRLNGIKEAFSPYYLEIPEKIVNTCGELINAHSNKELKEVLYKHSNLLLSDAAIQFLDSLIEMAGKKMDQYMLSNIKLSRRILDRCRQDGLQNFFDKNPFEELITKKLPQPVETESVESIEDLVEEFQNALAELSSENYGIITQENLQKLSDDYPKYNRALQYLSGTKHGQAMTIPSNYQHELASLIQQIMAHPTPKDAKLRVGLCRQALSIISKDNLPHLWATMNWQLGAALSQTHDQNQADNLEASIHNHKLADTIFEPNIYPSEWVANLNDLGNAYTQRTKGERAENIEAAIKYYHEVMAFYEKTNDRAGLISVKVSLGNVYMNRIVGNKTQNLKQAIEYSMDVVNAKDLLQNNIMMWADGNMNLANAYSKLTEGDLADNKEIAINHYKLAHEFYSKENMPLRWAYIHHNMGVAYAERINGDDSENIEQALKHIQSALEVHSIDNNPAGWAEEQNTLSMIYLKREIGDWDDNCNQAIIHLKAAIKVYTQGDFPVNWAKTNANLAAAYSRLRDKAGNIDKVIFYSQEALQFYTYKTFPDRWASIHNNLGIAYSTLSLLDSSNSEKNQYLTKGIEHFNFALQVRTIEKFPYERMETIIALGKLYFNNKSWKLASKYFSDAISIGVNRFENSYTHSGRLSEIENTTRLYVTAAYSLIKQSLFSQAFLLLEKGKTRLLVESLALNSSILQLSSEEEQQKIKQLQKQVLIVENKIRAGEEMDDEQSEIKLRTYLKDLRKRLNKYIERVSKTIPDFYANRELDLDAVLNIIPDKSAFVVPLITDHGGAVFILKNRQTTINEDCVLILNDFDSKTLSKILKGKEENEGWIYGYINWINGGAIEDWKIKIDQITQILWSKLMKPIHKKLGSLGLTKNTHLIIIPQGGLGLLPLHAACHSTEKGKSWFLDDYVVSYVPSVYSFKASLQRLQNYIQEKPSVLAIANPTSDLPHSSLEVSGIKEIFPQNARIVYEEGEVTKEAISNGIFKSTHFHFAGHAFYNWADVMDSALVLSNNKLFTLKDIIISSFDKSPIRLATLSACETGLTEFNVLPDEFIGLPTGFMQAGTPGILSSLWAVSDRATSLLMQRFYQEHILHGKSPNIALRDSQIWLRSLTIDELGTYYKSYIRMTAEQAETAFMDAMDMGAPEETPYSNPFYWAAFTILGA